MFASKPRLCKTLLCQDKCDNTGLVKFLRFLLLHIVKCVRTFTFFLNFCFKIFSCKCSDIPGQNVSFLGIFLTTFFLPWIYYDTTNNIVISWVTSSLGPPFHLKKKYPSSLTVSIYEMFVFWFFYKQIIS